MKRMQAHTAVHNIVGYIIAGALVLIAFTQAGAHQAEQSSPMNEHHKHDFPSSVYQFHQVLAPLWHSQPGRERVDAACSRASELHTLAQDIASAAVPERAQRNTVGWNEAVKDVITSIEQLSRACGENGGANAEGALTDVYRAFHGMVAYLGHRH